MGLQEGTDGLRRAAAAGDGGGWLEALARQGGSLAAGPAGEALRSGAAMVVEDLGAPAGAEDWRRQAIERGFRGVAALPLAGTAGPFGVLVICSDRSPAFEPGQLTLLEELVNDLAFGVMARRARIERDRAERAMEVQAAQLRMLAGEVVRTEQRERRRIAQLLHDQLQQLLAAALYGLSDLGADADPEDRRVAVARLRGLIRDSIAMSRSLTSELGHPALTEPDINAGLEWLAAWMKEKHGLSVTIDCPSPMILPAEENRITLFQIARELLFNVVTHAGVRTAHVAVDATNPDLVSLRVSDHGAGFEPSAAAAPRSDHAAVGLGLFSARERLALIGGRMEIESRPGRGTRVSVWVPRGASDATLVSAGAVS